MPAKPLQSTKPGRHFCSVSVDVAAAAALLKAIFWQSTRLDCGDVEREGGKLPQDRRTMHDVKGVGEVLAREGGREGGMRE